MIFVSVLVVKELWDLIGTCEFFINFVSSVFQYFLFWNVLEFHWFSGFWGFFWWNSINYDNPRQFQYILSTYSNHFPNFFRWLRASRCLGSLWWSTSVKRWGGLSNYKNRNIQIWPEGKGNWNRPNLIKIQT